MLENSTESPEIALQSAGRGTRQTAALLRCHPHPVLCFDAAGRQVYANRAAKQAQQALSATERGRFRQALQAEAVRQLTLPAPAPAELEIAGRWWQVTAVPLPDFNQTACYLLDTTAWHQTERQLRHEQHFRQLLLDTSPTLFMVYDESDELVYYNQAVRELMQNLQLFNDAAIRDPASAAFQERQRRSEINARVRQTNGEVWQEVSATLNSGEKRWYQTVRRPLTAPDGAVFVLGMATDISDLKRSEQQAEAKTQARENFMANLSHEVRTPLHGIVGLATQLGKTALTDQQRYLLRNISQAGTHLTNLLNDVLDFSRLNRGPIELEAVPFNPAQSVAEALQPLAAQAQGKGLKLQLPRVRPGAAAPWVLGDPHRLGQIIINLVSNAIKFTPRGRIRVSCRVLAETDTGLRLRLRVADTGIGVAPAMQARVFDDFVQASAGTSRQYGGAGLGLSISRRLARQMGGELSLASRPGKGSCFTLTLPLRKAPADAGHPAAAAPPPNPARLAGLRVLVADDNAMSREVTRLTLRHWNITTSEAAGGAEALQRLAAEDFDVALLDIQMPDIDGLEVLRQLRALPHPTRAHTPVIAFTAAARPQEAGRYRRAGFASCLSKPFAEAELCRQLLALPAAAPAYSLAGLRRFARGNETLVNTLVASFVNNAPACLAKLEAAVADGNWPAAARQVHHLRFNLDTLEVDELQACMATLLRPLQRQPTAPAPDAATLSAAARHFTAAVGGLLRALRHEAAAAATSS